MSHKAIQLHRQYWSWYYSCWTIDLGINEVLTELWLPELSSLAAEAAPTM